MNNLHKMKRIIYALFLVALLSSFIGGSNGNRSGAPGDTSTCSGCHSGGDNGGSISLSGLPASLMPSTTYDLTISLADDDAMVGGFQLVATDGATNTQVGTFTPGSDSRINDVDRLTHNAAKDFSSGSVSWDFQWTSPASLSSNEVQFYFAGNAANGNGQNGAGDFAYNSSTMAMALPVELSFFEAKRMKESVLLTWETLSELDNEGFEVEHSTDSKTWTTLGFVAGNGTSLEPNIYTFEHDEPKQGNNYYRLKQIDFDKDFEYSDVVQAYFGIDESSVQIYPNPVQDILTIENGVGEARIFNIVGREIRYFMLTAEQYNVEVSDLEAGIYLLQIQTPSGLVVKQFVK